ncbi:uncharacterized protein N7477_001812 [Penicillium maclennaniae]|uniref:uncharacterized protein n=1 Tax=Penicillium maclennaniae TaxID=1343394 RepID=UPI002540472E|nr:uncharacterized protein N7477_001812 [Penicillium maclennaniae]KAJ5681872.1 hypothetical protein N7477_001812 [Penicillium maclennaniae]
MPPKGYRKSMPGRLNSTMLTPSRRSPRVPAKMTNPSTQPSKSLDSSADSPDSSFNIRFYNPKTPTKSSSTSPKPGAGSPDLSLSQRRTFQARPSRLSTVFTPAVETPTSTGSRRTLRSTANPVQNQFSDDDFAETGWTLEQYLGLGYEEDMAGQTSPTKSSSMGTRTSARVRKPTERFLESQKSQPKPGENNGNAPAVSKRQTTKTIQRISQKKTPAPKNAFKASSALKGKQVEDAPELERIKIKEEDAAQSLYELARFALGPDFEIPENPSELIDELRAAYFKREAEIKTTRDLQDDQEAQDVRDALDAQLDEYDDSDDDVVSHTKPTKAHNSAKPSKHVKSVKDVDTMEPIHSTESVQPASASQGVEPADKAIFRFKKSAAAVIEPDGWVKTGPLGARLALILTMLFLIRLYARAPTSKLRATLLSASLLCWETGTFLPGAELDFRPENVQEEKARVSKVSSKTPAKPVSKLSSKTASTKPVKKSSKAIAKGGPKSESKSSKTVSKTAPKSIPKSTPKSTSKSTLKSTPKSAPKPSTKTPAKASAKTSAKAPSSAPATKVQRITLKLGPAPESENERTSGNSGSPDEKVEGVPVAKGKKRKSDVLSDEDEPKPSMLKKRATEKSTPVKSKTFAHLAPTTGPPTAMTIPTVHGRGSSQATARGSRGSRGPRGSRAPRGSPISQGRGRGRGSASVTETTTIHPAEARAATTSGSTNSTRGKQGEARVARGPSRARGRGRARGGA